MSDPEIARVLIRPLRQTGIRFMVTGGVASIIYGDPRLTNDVDIVADLKRGDAVTLTQGFPASEYYLPPVEVLDEEGARPAHGHFNILHRETALRADVYVAGDDPLMRWAIERQTRVTVSGDDIPLAPIEYVILMKLEYYRRSGSDRHLRDIESMRRISGSLIDQRELTAWIEQLGLDATWRLAARQGESP